MKPKYLLGVLILIVAIGGATACSILLPSGNTQTNQQSSDPVATTAPAVEQSGNTQTNQQSEPTVKAQTITCSKCGGSGTVSCSKCGGSGHVTTGGSCSACGGDGKQYVDANGVVHPNVIQLVAVLACHEQTCTVCGGTGGGTQSGTCSGCGGDGAVTCPKCGGTGHIHT